ncbi:MAG: saccharopine dehydrogenase NADP-binding domain-containing protein [Thermoprotei archaeon]|nr:saccharopine dehydrogenase NADP-binding domain-containing protein [Thermoprotei archaeon]
MVLGGAGDIGSGVLEALCSMNVDTVVAGDVRYGAAKEASDHLKRVGCNCEAVKVNAIDIESLREASRDVDVVVNTIGPFYRLGLPIAGNLVRLGLNFVDVCDDYDAVENILGLSGEAEKAGVTGITGLGWTPGLSNILALHGSKLVGEVEAIDIYWVGSAADSKGLAVVMHLFHALIGKVPMYLGGLWTLVDAGSGEVEVSFPDPIGRLKLYYTGHPEPATIPRYVKVRDRVTVRGGLTPPWQNVFAKFLLRALNINSDAKAERLARIIHRVEGVFRMGGLKASALKVDILGDNSRVSYVAVDRMRRLTGIPAALGAVKIAEGKIREPGIKPPEASIRDTEEFLGELERREVKIVKVKEP